MLEMSINGASTLYGLLSLTITGLCDSINPQMWYSPAFAVKIVTTILMLPPQYQRQWSVNIIGSWIMDNEMPMQWHYPVIKIMAAFIGKNVSDNIATTS